MENAFIFYCANNIYNSILEYLHFIYLKSLNPHSKKPDVQFTNKIAVL